MEMKFEWFINNGVKHTTPEGWNVTLCGLVILTGELPFIIPGGVTPRFVQSSCEYCDRLHSSIRRAEVNLDMGNDQLLTTVLNWYVTGEVLGGWSGAIVSRVIYNEYLAELKRRLVSTGFLSKDWKDTNGYPRESE